jgi:putative membrane protein
LAGEARRLAQGGTARTTRFYRIVNEVPTLILIAVVFLVVLKPF